MCSPGTEGTTHEGRDGGLKKLRSNRDESSGSVEAGLGIWKDWSKLNHGGVVNPTRGSETTCRRPPSSPLGYLGWEESESLSDKRLFFGRSAGGSVRTAGIMA